MLKYLRQSIFLRCFVILAFVFFLLPLHPNDVYAMDPNAEKALLALEVILGIGFLITLIPTNFIDQKAVSGQLLSKMNADEDGLTFSVLEW